MSRRIVIDVRPCGCVAGQVCRRCRVRAPDQVRPVIEVRDEETLPSARPMHDKPTLTHNPFSKLGELVKP